MSAYCQESDLYDYGIPRGGLPNDGRRADDVDTSSDSIELNVHGFSDDEVVRFRASGSGTLPSPLVEGTSYYVIRVDESHFKVSATEGGSAIDLTTSGSNVIVIAPLPVTKMIEAASALVEDMLPAHTVPLESPYPQIIIQTTAELAAGKLLARTGSTSVSLSQMIDFAQKRLERWSTGVPIRGDNEQESSSLAVSSATATAASDWRTYGGL